MASKILLADDSITIQKVVNLTFADEGIEVVAVSNGEQAERRLDEINPDLVLADIFMPGKNGYELCEHIKQSSQFRHVPVVLLVGAFEPFDQNEARRVRADAHLTKPFESRNLVETVRKLIDRSGKSRTGQLPPPHREEHKASQPLGTKPIVPPSFNIDLAAMSDQPSPAEGLSQGQSDSATSDFDQSSRQTRPLDSDYAMAGQAMEDSPIEISLEDHPSVSGSDFMAINSGGGNSEEITSEFGAVDWMPANESPDQINFLVQEQSDSPKIEVTGANSTDDGEKSSGFVEEFRDWTNRGSKVPSAFGHVGQDEILDFEKFDTPQALSPDNVISFDVDVNPPGVDAPTGHTDALQQSMDTDAPADAPTLDHSFDESDAPPSQEVSGFEIASIGMPEPAAPAAGATPPAMLSLDDPLGDILADDSATRTGPTESSAIASETKATEFAQSYEAKSDYEIIPIADASQSSMQPATLEPEAEDLSEDLSSETPLDFDTPFADSGTYDQRPQVAAPEPQPFDSPFSAPDAVLNSDSPFDQFMAEAEPPRSNGGWAASGFEFVAPQPGAQAAGDDDAAFATPPAHDEIQPLEAADAEFTSSAMWSEEETQFAPIDIDAVAVDDIPSGIRPPAQDQISESEIMPGGAVTDDEDVTGFNFIPSDIEEAHEQHPLPRPEQAPGVTESGQDEAPQAISLSPTVIDEIVRRVVAQMSESVVREIAWEIVPDCVERVVEKLSREALSKKL